MKIYDSHAHIFPVQIANKASGAIGNFYGIPMRSDGCADTLFRESRDAGIYKTLISSSATTAHQVRSINDFIAKTCAENSAFLGLGSLHCELCDVGAEISYIHSLGLLGIKIHPDFQEIAIDDERMFPMYEILEKEGFPILFHTGDSRKNFSNPARLSSALSRFPKLVCIAAHFGAYSEWENVGVYTKFENLYFDTSSSIGLMEDGLAEKLISKFGAEHFLFGTDFPMWSPKTELSKFMALKISDRERELILGKNFERLFGVH